MRIPFRLLKAADSHGKEAAPKEEGTGHASRRLKSLFVFILRFFTSQGDCLCCRLQLSIDALGVSCHMARAYHGKYLFIALHALSAPAFADNRVNLEPARTGSKAKAYRQLLAQARIIRQHAATLGTLGILTILYGFHRFFTFDLSPKRHCWGKVGVMVGGFLRK